MASNASALVIEGKKIDPQVILARALGLMASGRPGVPTVEEIVSTELSNVPTAMFDEDGDMRSTSKAVLQEELGVMAHWSALQKKKDAIFIDACAWLWTVEWPKQKHPTLQDFLDNVRKKLRSLQALALTYFICDRYSFKSIN